MLRVAIVFFLAIIPFTQLFSADWDPYPLNQGSYFQYNYQNSKLLNFERADSSFIVGNAEYRLLNSNFLHPDVAQCEQEILDFETQFGGYEPPQIFIDTILYVGDTVRILDPNETGELDFFPKASLGFSWNVDLTSAPFVFDSISFTCTSIELGDVFGIADSIKTFVAIPFGIDPDSTNIDEKEFVLSKNFGWIKYVDLKSFFINDGKAQLTLVGLKQGQDSFGYQQPSFQEYFPYSEGDVLYWGVYYWYFKYPGLSTTYQLDSITSVASNPQQVSYTYNRTTYDDALNPISYEANRTQTYSLDVIGEIINTEPGRYGVGDNLYNNNLDSNIERRWLVQPIEFFPDTNRTIFATASPYFESFINTETCVILEYATASGFELDTEKGLVYYSDGLWDGDGTTIALLASNIGGVQCDTIPVISSIEDQTIEKQVKIFPNPVDQILNVNFSKPLSESKFKILSLQGQTILEGNLNNYKVDLSEVPSGIYFIQIEINGKLFADKIIKK